MGIHGHNRELMPEREQNYISIIQSSTHVQTLLFVDANNSCRFFTHLAFSTVHGTRGSIAPHLLVPKPSVLRRFLVGNTLHQPGILATGTE